MQKAGWCSGWLVILQIAVFGCGSDGSQVGGPEAGAQAGNGGALPADDGGFADGDPPSASAGAGGNHAGGAGGQGGAAPSLCGNGAIDPGEDCDGTDLSNHSCSSLLGSAAVGQLACSSACSFDTSQCCVPSCGGNECGSDGCGSTCGSCSGGATCNQGQCVCTSHATSKCSGGSGDVYWYDSCGNMEDLKQDCPGTCSNGQCDTPTWRCASNASSCFCIVTADKLMYPLTACPPAACCYKYVTSFGDSCGCSNHDATQCQILWKNQAATKVGACPP